MAKLAENRWKGMRNWRKNQHPHIRVYWQREKREKTFV